MPQPRSRPPRLPPPGLTAVCLRRFCATGGGGRGRGRYAGEAGGALVARVLRPARAEVVASYHRLHHPSVPLGLLLARPEPGLVVVCLRKQAGSPSLVLLKTTQPLPYLASCRASSRTRRTGRPRTARQPLLLADVPLPCTSLDLPPATVRSAGSCISRVGPSHDERSVTASWLCGSSVRVFSRCVGRLI